MGRRAEGRINVTKNPVSKSVTLFKGAGLWVISIIATFLVMSLLFLGLVDRPISQAPS